MLARSRWVQFLTAGAAVLALGSSPGAADEVHGVPMPRGARVATASEAGRIVPLGFRAAVDHVTRWLRRTGPPVQRIGPYQARGVDVIRFVRTDAAGLWLAIHIWRSEGITRVSVIPRAVAPP